MVRPAAITPPKTPGEVLCRIDTRNEVEYFKAGGILHYVLRQLIAAP